MKHDIGRIPPVRKVNANHLAEDMLACLIIGICVLAVIVVAATS